MTNRMLPEATTRYELPEEGTSLLGYVVRRMHKTALLESAMALLTAGRKAEALLDIAVYAAAASTSYGDAYYQPSFNAPGQEVVEADPATGAVVTATLVSRSPHYDVRYEALLASGARFTGRETILGTTIGWRGLGMPAPSLFEFATSDGSYAAHLSGTLTSELVPGVFRRTRIRAFGSLDLTDNAGQQGNLILDRGGRARITIVTDGTPTERQVDLTATPWQAIQGTTDFAQYHPEKGGMSMRSWSDKAREVKEEFRSVVMVRAGVVDALLPPAVFLAMASVAGGQMATVAALLTGGAFAVYRLVRRQSVTFALLGLSASLVALLVATWLHRAELFYLPEVISNAALAAACLVSVALRRPLVAWTSHLMRRWPRDWYWHPRILPAYTEVTLAWAGFFLVQAALQGLLLLRQDVTLLAVSSLLGGWPATALLLILSYLYGTWRLARLAGPSTYEFREHTPPPWSGQRRGF
jgi:hypothetical protein